MTGCARQRRRREGSSGRRPSRCYVHSVVATSGSQREAPSRLLSGPGVLVAGAVLGSAGNLAFNRLIAQRLTGPAASDVRALLGVFSAVGFLSIGVQLAVVGLYGRSSTPPSFPRFERIRLLVALAVIVGTAAATAAVLTIDSSVTYRLQAGALIGITVTTILLSTKPRAELLLCESWNRLALLFVISPILRLVAATALPISGRPGLHLLPIVIGEGLTTCVAFWLRPRRLVGARSVPFGRLLSGGLSSAGLLVFLALSSIGLRSKIGTDAELFNSSATTARIVAFLPLTVSIIYFPRLARSAIGSQELRRAFLAAQSWTLTISTVTAGLIVAAPTAAFDLFSQSAFPSVSVVRILAIAAAVSATSVVSLFVYIAHDSRFAFLAWPIAASIAVGQIVAASAIQLAIAVLISSILLAIAVTIPVFLRVQPVLRTRSATLPHAVRQGDVTLVIPCFNPGVAVIDTIEQAALVLTQLSPHPTIIAVSDGSTDGSDVLIDELNVPMLIHLRHQTNRGKGAALRTGFAEARTEFVAFIDADGDLAPIQLNALMSAQQDFAADITFGSKVNPSSVVEASRLRRVYSSGYRRLIRFLFQLDIEDTQTGIKLYRREVLDAVLPNLREDKFALDLEIFVAARASGFDTFVGVPVVLRRERGTTISVANVLVLLGDTIRLFWRTKVTLSYAKSGSALQPDHPE